MAQQNGEVIKSFLVGLGFDIDESSLSAFNKSVQTAALRVTALYGAVNAFAGSMVYAFSKISEGFEEMGYQYHIIAPAINKAIVLRNELFKAYGAAGINIRKTIVESIKLNMSLTKTKFALEAIYKSVGAKFFGRLQKQSDLFRKKLYENMPYIQKALEGLVKSVFKALDAVTQLGGRLWSVLTRVYDFFVMLDKATSGWSTLIMGAVAAWKLLNLSFLATPLGMLLALASAVLLLYDDFKTFQEGGESFFNWGSKTTQMLVGLITIIAGVAAAFATWSGISAVVAIIGPLLAALRSLNVVLAVTDALAIVAAAPFWVVAAAIGAIVAALTLADAKWQIFNGGLSDFVTGIGGKVMDFLGAGMGDGADLNTSQMKSIGGPQANPVGSTTQNSSTNVNAQMQTQITVQGSPNADATARAAAQQQTGVNRDFVRNLKGATR